MNRFTFTMMNYKHDPVISSILTKGMNAGIKSVHSNSRYDIHIEFKDGTLLKAWNENRYYAWLSNGYIVQPDGSKYVWDCVRPSREVMSRLYNMLKLL